MDGGALLCEVNGRPLRLAAGATVASLVESLGLAGRKIAVEKNGEIVPRGEHARAPLQNGDRVEIVAAVGGG